jgi:hypothetical protein
MARIRFSGRTIPAPAVYVEWQAFYGVPTGRVSPNCTNRTLRRNCRACFRRLAIAERCGLPYLRDLHNIGMCSRRGLARPRELHASRPLIRRRLYERIRFFPYMGRA